MKILKPTANPGGGASGGRARRAPAPRRGFARTIRVARIAPWWRRIRPWPWTGRRRARGQPGGGTAVTRIDRGVCRSTQASGWSARRGEARRRRRGRCRDDRRDGAGRLGDARRSCVRRSPNRRASRPPTTTSTPSCEWTVARARRTRDRETPSRSQTRTSPSFGSLANTETRERAHAHPRPREVPRRTSKPRGGRRGPPRSARRAPFASISIIACSAPRANERWASFPPLSLASPPPLRTSSRYISSYTSLSCRFPST